ncbi:hypothetical protein EXM65_10745 [Clostridium botulinum]|uniref:Teichoic acid biosynthesis protein n=1 Tax=Clostridium botulinum TaxID=1491 RepID=A0A6M0SNZ3_CLOBO|nr:hypothetical protein [Clostridium botulinum]
MNTKFLIHNFHEDQKNLTIVIKDIENEQNISKYICGLYLESCNKKYFLCNLDYYNNKFYGKIEKKELEEFSKINNFEILKFKIKFKFNNDEPFLGIKYDKQLTCWQWKEYGVKIIAVNDEIKLINDNIKKIEFIEIFGEYEPQNFENGRVIINRTEQNKIFDNIILKSRLLDKLTNENYILVFRDRKNKKSINIDRNFIDEKSNKIIFNINSKQFKLLSYNKEVWNVYIQIKLNEKVYELRIKSSNKKVTPQLIIDNKNQLYNFRAYATKDNYLSFIMRDYSPKTLINSLDFDENKILIEGSLDILADNEDISIVSSCLKSIDGEELLSIEDLQQRIYNGINNFKIIINFDEIKKNKHNIEGEYYINLKIKLYNKISEYNLEFNSDGIFKEDVITYPTVILNNYKYPISITPTYKKMNLIFKIDNEFKIDFFKGKLKKKCIEITCKQNLKDNIKDINSEINLYCKNDQSVNIISNLKQNGENFVYNIPLDLLENLKIGEMYKFNIKLFNEKFELNKNIRFDKKNFNNNKRLVYINFKHFIINGSLFLLYKNNNNLVIRKENILTNGKILKIKFKLSKILAKIMKKFIKNPIWIVGENLAEIAQDNGFAFFEYCINMKKREKIYYVSKKNNINMQDLSPYIKNVLEYNSFKHMFYYNLAQYLIISHGIRDVMPAILHNKINSNNKEIIYLQHGITAMKKVFFNKNSYNSKIKRFIVTSKREKEILVNQMNFNENQIIITGFSRFDKLQDISNKEQNKVILVMPTWREWIIENKEDFIESMFFRRYISLLKNERLHKLLEKNDIELKFYPHIEIQKKYSNMFSNIHDNITIVKLGEQTVQELIKEASLMITDYSSVALDFNYLKKPSIFYHFDLDEYMYHRGSFIDLENELPGDVCKSEEELLNILIKYESTNFHYNPKYLDEYKKFYDYSDNNNCERIYKEIKSI